MPLQETSGTASYDAFGGGIVAEPNYIESCFSTWLYTGNGSTQTITNGIDLAGKGGLVWGKARSQAYNNRLFDTVRGGTNSLISNSTGATSSFSGFITSFNNNGFSIGTAADLNENGTTYASWTFRKQPKFFDVVTYTGTGSAQNIAHNLGSVPGCIIVKRTDSTSDWFVFHRKNGVANQAVSGFQLNATNAAVENAASQQSATTFNTGFVLNSSFASPNVSGATYVAYLFAHNAGGFGLTGTDNVISCGSVTSSASGPVEVNLGYEPQWILYKPSTSAGDWYITDTMRGWTASYSEQLLRPNSSVAESAGGNMRPTATGFSIDPGAATNWIYIAIRRGPMKVPTDGTSVFMPTTFTGTGAATSTTAAGFPSDLIIQKTTAVTDDNLWVDRLRGGSVKSTSNTTSAESSGAGKTFDSMTGIGFTSSSDNLSGRVYSLRYFRRAPGFFDEVCWSGTGVDNAPLANNLNALPELVLIKQRSTTGNWVAQFNFSGVNYSSMQLNTTNAAGNFSKGSANSINSFVLNIGANSSGITYVAYLFASCPGVSKVGSYTGNGSTQTINCGFTGGARFVLIKRTDSTGDWYVYDTARGMTTLTDPYLLLNSTAAESATLGSVTTVSTGFAVNASILAAINASGGSFIFFAVA